MHRFLHRGDNMLSQLLKMFGRMFVGYILAQTLTGVMTGVLAVLIMQSVKITLPAALAVTMPLGFPILLVNIAILSFFFGIDSHNSVQIVKPETILKE